MYLYFIIIYMQVPFIRWYIVMAFYYIIIPTCGNWFQTNPLEHESDDHSSNTVSSVCVTNGKDTALQWQIWSTFVTVLWFCKTEIQDRARISILVRVLWVTDFQTVMAIFAQFLQIYIWKKLQFLSHSPVEKNGMFSLFDTSVNGSVTFAYIITFHCTNV